ncbi:MAG: DUF5610 domain-containing protein [Nitrospirae bacterium]|nr:DUF5610 domain-containing protein [Nitrospirota bacterium]
MEVSIHAEVLRAQYLSTQLGGVYGGGGQTSFPPALDRARASIAPAQFPKSNPFAVPGAERRGAAPDSGPATVVSLSYKSLDLRISMDDSEVKELEESGGAKPALEDKFSPEAVSDRIIDFIKGLFQTFQGQDPNGDVNTFAGEVARGVEEGFAQAKELLKSMDMLTESLAKTIGETHRLTVDKLGNFFDSIGVTLENLLQSATELTGASPAQTLQATQAT